MEKELEEVRQEVERLRAGRKRGSLPYPEALRAFAVRYVAHALETGGTFTGAATTLGVSYALAEPRHREAWQQAQGMTRHYDGLHFLRVSSITARVAPTP